MLAYLIVTVMSLSFSVITPSYNQGQFIERTILSVLNQSDVKFEYRVQDGGSSDSTLDILRNFQDHIQWVSQKDEGQAYAVNRAMFDSTGDIIAWINSDDIYYPSALKKVEKVFEENPKVQVVYGRAHHIDQNDRIIDIYPTENWNFNRLKEICFVCQPATFFRRQFMEAYGPLDSQLQFCMDYELWLRYGSLTNFYYLQEFIAGSRLYEDTKTLGQRVSVHYEINNMLKSKFRISPERWVIAYSSIVIEDRDKIELRELSDFTVQLQRSREFIEEVFQSYARWRDRSFTLITAWMVFRWMAANYWRFARHKLSDLLSSLTK